MRPEPPTPEEVARVARLYEQWRDGERDGLTMYALIWQIPRLLAKIEHLEALLRTTVEARP